MSRTKEAMIEAGHYDIEDDGFITSHPVLVSSVPPTDRAGLDAGTDEVLLRADGEECRDAEVACERCNGTGEVLKRGTIHTSWHPDNYKECPKCEGSGEVANGPEVIDTDDCPRCMGSGEVRDWRGTRVQCDDCWNDNGPEL